jgi:hypothetical protein
MQAWQHAELVLIGRVDFADTDLFFGLARRLTIDTPTCAR